MIYTNSSLSCYNACSKKYYYKYAAMLDEYEAPVFYRDSDSLVIGQIIHKSMSYHYTDDKDYLQAIEENGWEEELIKKATAMMEGRVLGEQIGQIEYPDCILAVEAEIGCTVPGGNFLPDSKIAGKLDAIVKLDGKLWLVEHKTTSSKDMLRWEHATTFQTNLYKKIAAANGIDLYGVIINYFRVPSVYRRKKEEEEDYWQRLAEDIASNIESYYFVYKVPFTQEEEEDRWLEALATILAIEGEEACGYFIRRNWNACYDFNRACPFLGLCRGKYREEDFLQREELHVELSRLKKIRYPEVKNGR